VERRHTRIWRQLRSARTSALSEEQRRQELREAQQRSAARQNQPPVAAPLPPDSSIVTAPTTEAPADPAGGIHAG
jgi:hypothetical protein